MGRKCTYEEVKENLKELGYELISEKYINMHSKLIMKDKDNYYFYAPLVSLKNGNAPLFVGKSNPYTIQNIKLWCKLNNKPFELVSDNYEGAIKKLKWKCLNFKCNEEFEMNWNDICNNHGCGYCAGKQVGLSNCLIAKNPELAKEWHPTKNGDLTPYDVTIGSNKKIWWQCSKGHEWKDKIDIRSRYMKCPYCNHQRSSEEYNLIINNPELCKEWNYTKNKRSPVEYTPNSGKKVWWKCKECRHEWEARIADRNNYRGCPECNKSKGEKKIDEILKCKNTFYESQYIFHDLLSDLGNPLRFDFITFHDKEKTQLNILIEFDGIQHFEWRKGMMTKKEFETLKYHDKLKDEYCKNNNIKLLRISYDDFDNIEEILQKELNLPEVMSV